MHVVFVLQDVAFVSQLPFGMGMLLFRTPHRRMVVVNAAAFVLLPRQLLQLPARRAATTNAGAPEIGGTEAGFVLALISAKSMAYTVIIGELISQMPLRRNDVVVIAAA